MLKAPKDQLIFDNDEIIKNLGDARLAKNAGDIEKAEDAGDVGKSKDPKDGKDTRNAGKTEIVKNIRNAKHIRNKKAERDNNKAADGRDREDNEVRNAKIGDSRAQETSKPKDVKVGNNSVHDNKNQDNQRVIVEDVMDSDNRVIITMDFIDGVFADILTYSYDPLSLKSNSLFIVTATCSGQSHGKKFNFLFIFLLILPQGLTKLLIIEVFNCLACSPGTISALFWRKKICCSYNKSFLNGLYLLIYIKYMCFRICNRHVFFICNKFLLGQYLAFGTMVKNGADISAPKLLFSYYKISALSPRLVYSYCFIYLARLVIYLHFFSHHLLYI